MIISFGEGDGDGAARVQFGADGGARYDKRFFRKETS
jgi:hypothetical protein